MRLLGVDGLYFDRKGAGHVIWTWHRAGGRAMRSMYNAEAFASVFENILRLCAVAWMTVGVVVSVMARRKCHGGGVCVKEI
jgi:hypothetical protein